MQANAIGRSSKTVKEFLEKAWKPEMTQDEAIKLAVKSLLEVVQTGAKNIDLAVMEGFGKMRVSYFISAISLHDSISRQLTILLAPCVDRISPWKRLLP